MRRSILLALAKLTTPGTLLLVDWLGPSLSAHAPAVVVVTSVLVDVYLTVMKWLTSDPPRAARPTLKDEEFELVNMVTFHMNRELTSSTPYQARTVIPVGGGGSSSSPAMSMVMRKNRRARGMSSAVYAVSAAWRT